MSMNTGTTQFFLSVFLSRSDEALLSIKTLSAVSFRCRTSFSIISNMLNYTNYPALISNSNAAMPPTIERITPSPVVVSF
jgi:hypothetical protein